MLFYVVSKYAKYNNNTDDIAIALRYIPSNKEERKMSEYRLSKAKCEFIAKLMGVPAMFLIPISRDKYIEIQDKEARGNINVLLDGENEEKTINQIEIEE